MRWLGYRRVAFKAITVDAVDIRQRSKAAHVADLAQNIREHGDEPIHAPTVRVPGNVLLCGRDRMAALLVLKAKKVWVRLAECSDAEAADLEASENLHRRQDDRDEVIARAVRAKEAKAAADASVTNVTSRKAKSEARRAVARDAGVSVEAVRQAEYRARQGTKESSADPGDVGQAGGNGAFHGAPAAAAGEPAKEATPPNLDLLGCDDDGTRAVCKVAKDTQAAIDEADKHLRLALGALKRIELTKLGQELRAQVERVGSLVRSNRPEFICPWCKGLPKEKIGGVTCGGCGGDRWVTAEKAARAPREFREASPPVIAFNGAAFRYTEARDAGMPKIAPPKNGHTNGKTIAVVDESGTDLLAQAMAEEERELTVERDETDADEAY